MKKRRREIQRKRLTKWKGEHKRSSATFYFFPGSSHYWALFSYFLTALKVIFLRSYLGTGMVVRTEVSEKTLAFKMDELVLLSLLLIYTCD